MAVDMFIKIDGIGGESEDHKYKGEIDILAWSWGASNSGTMHIGGGGGAGKVNAQDLSFTKWVDKSSPVLMEKCFTGKHIAKANLIVRKAGEEPVEYLKIDLKDILVTSVQTGGSSGEERLTENVTLNFAHVKYIYHPQDIKGKQGAEIPFGYDIKQNKKD